MGEKIIVSNAGRLKQGKRAILAAMTTADRYRIGEQWESAQHWQHGKAVDEVNHFNRHSMAVGALVDIEDDEGRRAGRWRIERIEQVDTGDLVDEQLGAMGYSTHQAFAQAEPGYKDRRAWLMYVSPVKRRLFGWRG